MKNRNIKHSDNWATPKDLYDKLDKEFIFDHDPCPLESGEILVDGLDRDNEWGRCNFVNPPYNLKDKVAFVERAVEEKKKGNTSVLLIPVSTSTKLFHDTILPNADDIRFLKGRVKFVGVNTKGELVDNKCGMHDSMIVVFMGEDV